MAFDLNEYIDVKQRIQLFYDKYPEGSLRFEFMGVCEWNPEMIWGVAYAYRTPNDPNPAVGTAQELAQGKTSFTRGSELMNLETSAWGRAIAALGIGLGAGVATRQEVASAKERSNPATQKGYAATGEQLATKKQIDLILESIHREDVDLWKAEHKIDGSLTKSQASKLIEELITSKQGEQG